jgi:putative FmdB family regulatory protein
MPLYEYRCADCGATFEKLRGMSEKDAPLDCPTCGGAKSRRQLSVFAASVSGGTGACGWNESTGSCSRFG